MRRMTRNIWLATSARSIWLMWFFFGWPDCKTNHSNDLREFGGCGWRTRFCHIFLKSVARLFSRTSTSGRCGPLKGDTGCRSWRHGSGILHPFRTRATRHEGEAIQALVVAVGHADAAQGVQRATSERL